MKSLHQISPRIIIIMAALLLLIVYLLARPAGRRQHWDACKYQARESS